MKLLKAKYGPLGQNYKFKRHFCPESKKRVQSFSFWDYPKIHSLFISCLIFEFFFSFAHDLKYVSDYFFKFGISCE